MRLHEGLLVTDAELRAIDVNPTYCAFLGVARDELIGTVPVLLRPSAADRPGRARSTPPVGRLRSSGHWGGELLERRRNGEVARCMPPSRP